MVNAMPGWRKTEHGHAPSPDPASIRSQESTAPERQHCGCSGHTKAAPKVPHSSLFVLPWGRRSMSSLTLHSPSHLLEGQYMEQGTKMGPCQPLASLLTLTALDLPRSFQDIFQPSMWSGESPRRANSHHVLGVECAGRGRILWKHHTQLCKGLSRNSTMVYFSCSYFLKKGRLNEKSPFWSLVPISPW